MRVLVVSESAAERARASSILSARDGVELVEATSARDAKLLLAAGDIDVLVVDGDLSPQGGYSFLYEAREAAAFDGRPSPPAIILTDRPQDRWLAGWAQADATLPLPADPFAVARTVEELVPSEA